MELDFRAMVRLKDLVVMAIVEFVISNFIDCSPSSTEMLQGMLCTKQSKQHKIHVVVMYLLFVP